MDGINGSEQDFVGCQITKRRDALYGQILTGIDALLELVVLGQKQPNQIESLTNKVVQAIDEFEAAPKLLDENLHVYFSKLLGCFYRLRISAETKTGGDPQVTAYLRPISRIVYTFAKVRGFKHISQLFTTNIYVVPEIVQLLEGYELINNDDELFVSLLWVSNLVLVPFSLDLVGGESEPGISRLIYDVLVRVFDKYETVSKNLNIATEIMARLLSRQDQTSLRLEFLSLGKVDNLGYLMTMNKLIKRVQWNNDHSNLTPIIDSVRRIIDCYSFNAFLLTYRVKLMGKLVELYSFANEFESISMVINQLHHIIEQPNLTYDLKYTIAKAMYTTYGLIAQVAVNYAQQYLEYVWSELIENPQADLHQYHIGLLFFGYIFLNGLGEKNPGIASRIIAHAGENLYSAEDSKLGTNIREASLFCYYGFVREVGISFKTTAILYDATNIEVIVSVFFNLLKLVLFDLEIYIRRCAFAVLQEFLGRLGVVLDASGEFQLKAMELLATQGILRENSELVQCTIKELVRLGVPASALLLILIGKLLEPDCPNIERRRILMHWYVTTKEYCGEYELPSLCHYSTLDEYYLIQNLSRDNSPLDLDIRLMILIGIGQWRCLLVEKFKKEFQFNPSIDSILKGENRLNLYVHDHNHKVEETQANEETSFDSLILIFKVVNTKGYDSRIFILFMQTSPKWEWNYVISLVPHHIHLAECIMWHPECPWLLWLFVDDTNIHHTIRCALIDGISTTWDMKRWDHNKKAERVLQWLDDYTMTNQGDVGSGLRRASMRLIRSHIGDFSDFKEPILARLVQMMGEGIDSVRKQAKQLAVEMIKETDDPSSSSCALKSFEETNDYGSYFKWYFGGYTEHWSLWKTTFWKGLVTILGSTVGSRLLINGCFMEFYRFILEADATTKEDVFGEIISLMTFDLKNKNTMTKSQWNRYQKVVGLAVQLVLRMFECGLFPKMIPTRSELVRKLYVRCYNLTLGKRSDERMIAVIKIMALLGTEDAQNRVELLLERHKLQSVKNELEYY